MRITRAAIILLTTLLVLAPTFAWAAHDGT